MEPPPTPGKGQGSVRQWVASQLVCVGRRSRSSERVDGHQGRCLARQSSKGSVSKGRAPGRCLQSAPGLQRWARAPLAQPVADTGWGCS